MEFTLKAYDNERNYIEYYNEKEKGIYQHYTNAEYFIFDVTCEAYEDIMCSTGGFTANVTKRYIDENNLDCAKIALCTIPQKYNDFLFAFVYLDKDDNILAHFTDSCPNDYIYFKQKFADCIVEEGFIYELCDRPCFAEITDCICNHPSTEFDFQINGQPIHFGDTFIVPASAFITRDSQAKLNADKMLLTLDTNIDGKICFKASFLTKEGNDILKYQVYEKSEEDVSWKVKPSNTTDSSLKTTIQVSRDNDPDDIEVYTWCVPITSFLKEKLNKNEILMSVIEEEKEI